MTSVVVRSTNLFETYVKLNTSKPGARKKYASSPFETYVKSNTPKTSHCPRITLKGNLRPM